ncbi:MAG: sigma-70 family RNA polymerase sigma factor [Chloroflexota bacterium]|nr:sigma-70 family RNA polymerase sigma factor [Chloroflexota bacterium]
MDKGRTAIRAGRTPADGTATSAADDAALVARARDDPAAFAPLYERYLDPVYRYCYRRLGGREAAEDATAQVFAKALAALPAYRDGSFRAWLFAIAHNAVADNHRRRAHRPEAPLEAVGDPPDRAPTPEEVAVENDERRSVRALLAVLPVDQRRVLELRLAGLSGAEIATALGRSVAAVKMLQLRAMTRLRADLVVGRTEEETTDGDA